MAQVFSLLSEALLLLSAIIYLSSLVTATSKTRAAALLAARFRRPAYYVSLGQGLRTSVLPRLSGRARHVSGLLQCHSLGQIPWLLFCHFGPVWFCWQPPTP